MEAVTLEKRTNPILPVTGYTPHNYYTVVPYPGELFILNKLLDAIIDVNGERSVNDPQKLFLVRHTMLRSDQGYLKL